MASKRQQTMAKRARELAVKEKRELKRAKKAARAANGVVEFDEFGQPVVTVAADDSAEPADAQDAAPADEST